MLDYRLYCLDGGGKFTTAHVISAATDDEAVAAALEMNLGSCELWERNRMVAKLDSDDL